MTRHKQRGWATPEAFCADVRGPLVGTLELYVGQRATAEELAQEALVRAWQRWDQLEHPRAWTYRCAFNLARSGFRRRQAERRANARASAMSPRVVVDPDAADAVAVRRAVSSLSERQRQVVLARFYAQLTVAETADVMSCAEGTVKSLTSQAIGALRRSGLAVDEPGLDQPSEVATDA